MTTTDDRRVRATQCTAMSKRSGQRCRKYAIRGATICRFHGANKRVRDRASINVTMQELLRDGDARAPQEVLLDSLAAADAILRDVKVRVVEAETVDPDLLDRFTAALERAARLAKVTLDANVQQRIAAQIEADGQAIAFVLLRTLQGLGLEADVIDRGRSILRQELIALDARGGVIEGELLGGLALGAG